jgi:hypothetical protein
MIGVKGYEPQETAFPQSDRAYSLAESQRIDLAAAHVHAAKYQGP